MSEELARALARKMPGAKISALEAYPQSAQARTLAAVSDLCFLDVVTDPAAATAILASLVAELPQLHVIVLLRSNDPDLILKCLRRGAAEFLLRPFTYEQISVVLAKLARFCGGLASGAHRGGKVYCVLPAKGASGATTLACNLALAFRRQNGGRVLLADLDGLAGTVAFTLKLKSHYSFVDAVSHAGALETDVWRALITPSHSVDVLLSPDSPVDGYAEKLDPAPLVSSARQCYDTIVLDAGGVYGSWNLGLARLADELMLVTTNELPALHAASRALGYLERNAVSRSKPRLLIGRYDPKIGLDAAAVEKALGLPVFCTLPRDCETIRKALMDGKPVPPASRFGRATASLARTLSGGAERVPNHSMFTSLRSMFGFVSS
jgi:pilus assembly protein CpaE